MEVIDKKNVTFSLPVETNKKLGEIAKKHNMTKSGLINFYVLQSEAHNGDIFM